MAIYTIKVRINEKQALSGLTEVLAEQVSSEIDEDIYSIKGMRKAIRADAKALLPKYMKEVLKGMGERADDALMDVTDDMLGWPGNWKPLAVVVGNYACDTELAEEVEGMQRGGRIELLRAEAAELGLKVVPYED